MSVRKSLCSLLALSAMAIGGGAMIVSAATSIDQVGSDIDGEAAEDSFGESVSLSADGTIVAIGASYNDGNGVDSGHVRVYERNGNAWVQKGGDIDGEAAGDRSGRSVSLSAGGTIVAIGARYNDGNGVDSGHVRVYEWNGSAWVQKGVDIDGEAAGAFAGSVALSAGGTIVAIGAIGNDGTGTKNFAGHVRVYEWDGSAWVQKGSDIDGDAEDDRLGLSVSLSADGTRVAMGAPYNDGTGSDAGLVRVYEWDGSAWVQKGVDLGGEAADDNSGWSVALSADGTRVAVGAYFNDGRTGHVRVYEWDGSAWVQKGVDLDGEAADDYSGWSVALSADGTEVAIGAPGHESYTGYVRVYEWDGSAWVQKYVDLDGDRQYGAAGTAVALSADGNKVAFGADGDNKVRIYSGVTSLNITYDSQGGSAVSDGDAATTVGGTIGALPTAPTRDGYTFAGWFTVASGGSEITTSAAHNQTADFTLYAQWTANPTTTTTVAPTTTTVAPTTTTVAPTTTTVAPTTTTTVAPVAVELPATGLSGGTVAQVLLVLGIGGLVMLVTRRRLNS